MIYHMPGDDLFSRFLELSESGGQVDKNPELALCIYYSFVSWDSLFQVRLDSRGDIIRRRIDKTRIKNYLECTERLIEELLYRLRIEEDGPLCQRRLKIPQIAD